MFLTYHLAYHHDIGTQVLVDPKDVQQADVPVYDVNTVDHPAIAHQRRVLETEDHAHREDQDGHEIGDVPVFLQPDLDLL